MAGLLPSGYVIALLLCGLFVFVSIAVSRKEEEQPPVRLLELVDSDLDLPAPEVT